MKKILLSILIAFGLQYNIMGQSCTATITAGGPTRFCSGGSVELTAMPAGSWTQKAQFGGMDRYHATGFSIGEKVYVGTGLDLSPYNDFWEYDPSSNTWTQKANFGGSARIEAIGFSIGNKGFIGTGYDVNNTEKKDFWEYDPAANTWMRRADFGGSARYKAVGFSIGNKGYIGTGSDRYSNKFRDFWEYDPSTGDWTQKANFGGTARYDAVGFSIGNKGFIGTGYDFTGMGYDLIQKNDFWEYNPASDTWAQKADVAGIGRSGAVGFSIAGKGFIGTGYVNGQYSKDFWEYDPALNKWTRKEDLNGDARTEAIGIGTGTRGYIGTGIEISSTKKADFLEYDQPNASTYLWSNGATTPSITATLDGSYTVRVTNSAGCSAVSDPLKVTVRPVPSFTAHFTNVSCIDANDGIITINATGGNGTYSYSINGAPFVLENTFTGLPAATYRVITGSNDCASLPQDIVVSVNPGNISSPTITAGGPTTFCQGGNVVLSANQNKNDWDKKADFKGKAIIGGVSFSIGNKGYFGTGYDPGAVDNFWEYDPIQDSWTQKANFGGSARAWATGFSIGNKGYIGTGSGGSLTNDFWEYDPISNSWLRKADFEGTARYQATSFSVGNKGYLGLGVDISGALKNDFWEYDPTTDDWMQKGNFAGTPRFNAAAFTINNKGYVGTGFDGADKNDFWEYNPGNDKWTRMPDFGGTSRTEATGFSIQNKGYIGLGYVNNVVDHYKKDFWEFDPIANIWLQRADFGGTGRHYAAGFSVGNKGYIGMGDDGIEYKNDFWEYAPGSKDTYLWSNGATTPSITATTGGSYTVRVTNPAGCNNVSDPVIVTVKPVPSFTAQVTDVSCMGANDGRITINATGGNGIYSYSKNGSQFVPGNTFTGLAAGTYHFITGSNDCASLRQYIVVGVSRDTIAPTIICPKNITVVPATSQGTVVKFPKPVVTDNCVVKSKEQISGPLSGSMFPIGITEIWYEATDGSGNSTKCSFTITVTDANKYGRKLAIPGMVGIDVFPNPGNGRFVLQLNNMKSSNASVLIMDAKGTIVQRKEISKASFSNTILFDLGRKAAGIYIVKFVSAEAVYATRVLVEQ